MNSQRKLARAAAMLADNRNAVLFVSPLLRTREIKMAHALRQIGWTVVLIYTENTPFTPDSFFDLAIRARSVDEAHSYALQVHPPVCHAFSGAVDDLLLKLCNEKPGPLVIDMNDVFCPALFNYCHERFEPTRECLAKADGLCARDLQARFAERLDGFALPKHTLLFPEYAWAGPLPADAMRARLDSSEIRVASVGTFSLETQGMYDSCYRKLAELLVAQKIHFHIYPHWFFRKSSTSSFNWDPKVHLAHFYDLEAQTPYLHVHESLSVEVLRDELTMHDFGLISGGCPDFEQRLHNVTPEYMNSCYSGRIADYLDARMPVLVNKEVTYNFQILRHYRIDVDLNRLTRSDFREYLRKIKHDEEQRRRTEQAAEIFSLRRHASRLACFYKRLGNEIGDPSGRRVQLPRQWSAVKKVPVVGRNLRRLENHLNGLHETIDDLRASVARQQIRAERILLERASRQAVIDGLTDERGQLQAKLDQAEHDLRETQCQLLSSQRESLEAQRFVELSEQLQEKLDHAEHDLGETQSQLSSSQGELLKTQQCVERSEQLQAKLDQAEQELGEVKRQVSSLQEELLRRQRSVELRNGPIAADLVSGLLNWPEVASEHERNNGFRELLYHTMLFATASGPLSTTSVAWELLASKNFDELLSFGYRDFKRTVARNYFTFFVQDGDPQLGFLEAALGHEARNRLKAIAEELPDDPHLQLPQQVTYRYFVLLLWNYVRQLDKNGYLDILEEPAEGNPLALNLGGRRVSQDLLNSVLEYYSLSEAVRLYPGQRVLEIGGGYGRTAFVISTLHPEVQCTLVDIPPALYIAQRYLSAVFPDRKVFRVQEFGCYDHVRKEIEEAAIVFLLPHQLPLLPSDRFALCTNISSFGEMRPEMIEEYFSEIDRLTNGTVYIKQWKVSKNPFDHLEICMDDYPIRPEWQEIYRREARVQSEFFEAAYRIGSRG